MIWLAIYDISDDSERERVAQTLLAWGFARIQRSAFIGRLPRGRAADLAEVLRRILRGRGHIVLIPVTEDQLARRLEIGAPQFDPIRPPRQRQVLII